MKKQTNLKPFLKWAGGKRQLLLSIMAHVPRSFDTYYEPFVGGGAVLFELLKQRRIKKAVISDNNWLLVTTYKAIKNNVEDVITTLKDMPNDEKFYYEIRGKEFSTEHEQAARLIYLNKTCFNGLFRVNKGGKFNVPFGKYKNPTICDEDLLRNVSRAIQDVEIIHADFEEVLKSMPTSKDFVYIDPPYIPLNTGSFTSYTSCGFTVQDHGRLASTVFMLQEKDIRVLVSNSDTQLTKALYLGMKIEHVEARRNINSNGKKRGAVNELLICNY